MKHRQLWLTLAAPSALFGITGALRAAGSEFDENPVPMKAPPPEYPVEMREQHMDGLVLLKVSVNSDGAVESCEVKKSTNSNFESPAVNAVKKWKFKPAVKGGTPVPSKILLPVKFDHEA